MSEMEFECKINLDKNVEVEKLVEYIERFSKDRSYTKIKAFRDIEEFLSSSIEVIREREAVKIYLPVGNEISYKQFEKFINILEIVGAKYKARLFDSSSGGIAVWDNLNDEAIEFEGKNVLILGSTEESSIEELIEQLVNLDVNVQEELMDSTQLVIVANNPNAKMLDNVNKRNIQVITERKAWERIMDEP